MYTIWRTGHYINEEVTKAIRIGSMRLSAAGDGFTVKDTAFFHPEKITASIAYGILRGTERIFKACQEKHKEWWEIDKGYFRPHHFDGYYRITMNGTRAKYDPAVNVPDDRWQALKINLSPWREDNKGYILICPPTYAVIDFYGCDTWLQNTLDKLRNLTDRPIIVRNKNATTSFLESDLYHAYCVVSYNSNVALEALVKGVPAISNDLDKSLEDIEGDLVSDREALFKYLAYCQFTLDEFKTGIAWRTANGIQKYKGEY